ncbi:hypothetical protein HYC85_000365 [Camellia sinensis]|uniref:Uncharacterized protein n=1 Tax=Camellia sinensis TaxID=4442 RepID=A0A7J7I3V9_CAMSI|nr:hypothetical protein HYC85_000365 [Camellia sinensis]
MTIATVEAAIRRMVKWWVKELLLSLLAMAVMVIVMVVVVGLERGEFGGRGHGKLHRILGMRVNKGLGVGPFGPDMVRKYTSARFDSSSTGQVLNEEESKLLSVHPNGKCQRHLYMATKIGCLTKGPKMLASI